MTNFSKLKKLIDICIAKEIAFVSFRLPDSQEVNTYIQHKTEKKTLNFGNLLANESGFVFAPFFEDEFNKKLLIEPDAIIINDDFDEALLIELANAKSEQTTANTNNNTTTTYEAYTQNVAHAIETIKAKKLEKVVISKTRVEALPKNFEASSFYFTLLENYSRAMVYLFQHQQQCWIGASPEPLLLKNEHNYNTVSLAGTQAIQHNNTVVWSEKEYDEQKIVSDFIVKQLQKLNVSNIEMCGPESFKAGNLMHLLTKFSFESTLPIDPFIKALHPTPSIAGMEKEKAIAFIRQHEKHNRSYYSGYLGLLNINKKTSLYVNLRCMQLFNNYCVLYAGAGITANSDPDKEWHETENKLLTLKRFLV